MEGTYFTPMATHGVKHGEIYLDERVQLGTRIRDERGNLYEFVKYGATVDTDDNVSISAAGLCILSGAAGFVDGISVVAGVINDYTFVGVQGVFNTNLATGVLVDELLAHTTDGNGDMLETLAASLDGVRGRSVAGESSGLGLVRLF